MIGGNVQMNMKMTALATAALATLAITPAAHAQAQLEIGQLVCKGEGGFGLIIASKKTFGCTFKPAGKHREQFYRGSITNIGIDIGKTGETTLVWTVLSSSDRIAPGMLSGSYGGAGANASVGVGGGASLLVGGSKNSVSLQPLSGQVQTGLNIAAGIKGLTLRAR